MTQPPRLRGSASRRWIEGLSQLAHGRCSARAHRRPEHGQAGHQGGELRDIELDWRRRPDWPQAHAAAAPAADVQRDPPVPEALHVSRYRPDRHPVLTGQLLEPETLTPAVVQPFDQRLLALDATKREMPVPGSRRELGSRVHDDILKTTRACPVWLVAW